VLEGGGGAVLVKSGAEGVCAAAILGRGLGLAVKIDDGAKRASETVMAALLAKYCEQHVPFRQMVIELCRRPVLDSRGLPAGDIRPAQGWLALS
jgi:L-asparaginase II